MATQTQTAYGNTARSTRMYDYLYDPVYTVSSETDHVRATFQANTNPQKLKRVPIYNAMFSELHQYPSYEVRLDTVDPVPRFISRQWRGLQSNAQNTAQRQQYEDPQVTGANRYKYFRRPLIPYNQTLGPEIVLDSTSRQDAVVSAESEYEQEEQRGTTPFTKVAQTQTDYRDSDTQTDPYSPVYMVRPGTKPELLTLAMLAFGHGLPAGLAEIEMIERARAKRLWEVGLPALHDSQQVDKRRKMMEQQELSEWATREREIEKIQEARLQVLFRLLKQREDQHIDLNTKRLDRLWLRKQEELKARVDKIRHEHMRTIRTMIERKKKKVEGRLVRHTITDGYADFGSQAYAPLTRIGIFVDRNSEQFVVKNKYLANYAGLLELEESLPDILLKPVVRAPKRCTTTSAGFLKRKYREEKQLADIYQALKNAKTQGSEPPKPLRFLQRVEKPVPRPPTPSIHIPEEGEENRALAITYLQQVMRGRAVQSVMHDGKEKRVELISEMRSTHALQAAQQQLLEDRMQATRLLQQQQQSDQLKESMVDELLSLLEGETLSDMLDFLNKELVRLGEERRIQAMTLLAERSRRIQEAEEAGQRQAEERRQREHDEIFKQVIKVQQTTVDAYLEDIVSLAIDRTANAQARQEVQQMAAIINDTAYEAEQRCTEVESEEIVAELVHGFLLPEVQKQAMRDKVHHQQRKYLLAAHEEVYGNIDDMIPADDVLPDDKAAGLTKDQQDAAVSARPSSIATSPFSGQSSLSRQSSQHAADADYVPPSRTASSAPATRSSKQSSSHSRASLASGRSTAASSRPRSGDGRASSLQHSPPGSVRDGTPGSETSAKDLGEELSDADSKGSARSATSSRIVYHAPKTPSNLGMEILGHLPLPPHAHSASLSTVPPHHGHIRKQAEEAD